MIWNVWSGVEGDSARSVDVHACPCSKKKERRFRWVCLGHFLVLLLDVDVYLFSF